MKINIFNIGLSVLLLCCIGGARAQGVKTTNKQTFNTERFLPAMAEPAPVPFSKLLPGPVTDYEMMRARSRVANVRMEYVMEIEQLDEKGFEFEETKGRCGSTYKPWLMIRNIKTQKGIALSLAYSGNWRMEVKPQDGNTLVRIATVPESLKPFRQVGDLSIPGALVSEFQGDWDDGAQPIVRFIREKLLRPMDGDWPWVMYNSWYDSNEKISQEGLIANAGIAAALGCELFVIDAGWYGDGDGKWSLMLGNWEVNKQRLPDGIEPVADRVRQLGMKFGMWVEIENAHPDSPVGKAHPDWFLHVGDKPASTRSLLDFSKPEVLAWAKEKIHTLMKKYQLDFIKMDFNGDLQINSHHFDGQPESALSRHLAGLVSLWEYMREKYPDLIIENCASGSLRQDILTAAFTDTHWVSDNVGNHSNLAQNFGATYLYPPEMNIHWTCYPADSESMDVRACFVVNMLGQLGLSGKIVEWDSSAQQHAREIIALYKQLRPIIRNSYVYHLTAQTDQMHSGNVVVPDPARGNRLTFWINDSRSIVAVQYADPSTDKSIVFAFQGGDEKLKGNLKLCGLAAEKSYRVEFLQGSQTSYTATGLELMRSLPVDFKSKGTSVIVLLAPVDETEFQ
jgi:alpha-galactosidase